MGIKAWITVRGQHIPIMDGENKMQAVGRFIKGKREKSRESVRKGYQTAGYNRKYAEEAELQQRKQLGEYKGNKQFERQRTIKGRARTKDEIEDERFDKYDKYAHNAARNIRFDNRKKPLSQDELYDRAHAIAQASSMYDMDYKYGKGGKHENKQVKIGDEIESARYKLKTDKPKRAAKGELTEKKLYLDYKNNYTTDELKAYKRQLDRHYRRFKNSNKYGDDITARNYRAITTVLAERRKRK